MIILRTAYLLAAILGAGSLASSAPAAEVPATVPDMIDGGTRYHLTFDDEFNTFSSSRWSTADFWGMRNNGGDFQAQWFSDPTGAPKESGKSAYDPFLIKDGVLSIQALPTPANAYSGPGNLPSISGQLTSAHRFTQRYGYYELRARLPKGKGLWSRFWLLTDDGVWPGEYDIFEVLGKDAGIIHQTTHFKDTQRSHAAYGDAYKGIDPFDGRFHTYGFLWEKTGVTWLVDGVATLRQINRINIPMYVLIDLVVGKDPGNLWPGNPDAGNTWPATMDVDYYRVYSNDPSLPSVVPDDGYAPSTLPFGFTVETTPVTPILPAGWKAAAVGAPECKGSSTWNPDSGEWMLKGAGYGNQCQFAATPTTGDGTITATVTSASLINANDVRAGVAFRGGWNGDAPEVSLVYLVSYDHPKITHRIVLQSRGNGPMVELASVKNTDAPATLRLVRSGNTFTGSYSTDAGRSWLQIGDPQVVAMPESAQAGILVGGNQNNYLKPSRAMFEKVKVAPGR